MATATSPKTGGELGKIRSFLLDHEKLLIVVILAALCWWGYGKYAQIRLDHDSAALKQATLVAAQQAQQNAALATQAQQQAAVVAADKAQLQALSDKVTAQNQQLTAANVALVTALTKQQHTDATLPIPDLVNRWAELAPGVNFDGAAVENSGNVEVTPANARATVETLEQVPALKTELANETTKEGNDQQIITTQNKNIFDLNGQVTTLNASVVGWQKQDTDDKAQCVDQIKVVKDEARKSKRRWFIAGYIAGFLTKVALAAK